MTNEPVEENIPTTEQIQDFVVAAHGNLPRVRELVVEFPGIVNRSYQWGENDVETAIQAAAQSGSSNVAEYLLAHGAPLEICTAAMLGMKNEVQKMLDKDPSLIKAKGAHGIALMTHAAMSNNLPLVKMLFKRGATEGMAHALGNAVMKGYLGMATWLLENGSPDMTWKNYDGKGLLEIAGERGDKSMLELLRKHGAS